MNWQLRPMQTMGESDEPWGYWLLFRTGEMAKPVAVINAWEMQKLVEQYEAYEVRKAKQHGSGN